jgi:cell division protein DivIC
MESGKTNLQSQVITKGTRRRLRLLMVIVLCFMGWAGVTLWDQIDKVEAKKSKLEIMESKLEEAQNKNEIYQHEIIRLNDPEYLEQLIRKDLNMTKDGETLFIQTR